VIASGGNEGRLGPNAGSARSRGRRSKTRARVRDRHLQVDVTDPAPAAIGFSFRGRLRLELAFTLERFAFLAEMQLPVAFFILPLPIPPEWTNPSTNDYVSTDCTDYRDGWELSRWPRQAEANGDATLLAHTPFTITFTLLIPEHAQCERARCRLPEGQMGIRKSAT